MQSPWISGGLLEQDGTAYAYLDPACQPPGNLLCFPTQAGPFDLSKAMLIAGK